MMASERDPVPGHAAPVVIAATLAIVIGGVVLVGWALDIATLTSVLPNWVAMKPNTAIAFVLIGYAQLLATRHVTLDPQRSNLRDRVAQLCGLLVGAIGLFSLAEYAFDWDPGFDQWLFTEPAGAVGTTHPGRMAPDSAVCFVLLATGLALVRRAHQSTRARRAALVVGGVVTTIALIELFSYFYITPIPQTSGGSAGLTMMALPTSVVFLALGSTLVWLTAAVTTPAQPTNDPGDLAGQKFVLIFVGLAVGIVATGTFYYRSNERSFQAEVEHQLASIADLKVAQLVTWRNERLADGAILFENESFSHLVRRFLAQPEDAVAQGQLINWLGNISAAYGYDQLQLMDAQGVTRLSVPEVVEPVSSVTLRTAAEVRREGKVQFQDFYLDEHNQRIYLQVVVPIVDPSDRDRSLGTVNLRIDPWDFLYPFIQDWPVPSKSGETLIVRRDGDEVLFLNDVRFIPHAALDKRIALDRLDVPAVQAVIGDKSVVNVLDYRGMPVLSAQRAISGSPWFMVAKVDRDEAYAPVTALLRQIVATIAALLVAAGAGLSVVWRQQRLHFYRQRAGAADKLRESEQLLADAQTLAGVGSYVLDIPTGSWQGSAALGDLFGIDVASDRSREGWAALIHPDDREKVIDDFNQQVLGHGQPFRQEYRIIRHDTGAERWVHEIATTTVDVGGRIVRVRGSVQDITERKQLEAQLRQDVQFKQLLFDGSPTFTVVIGLDGKVLMMNRTMLKAVEYTWQEAEGRDYLATFVPEAERAGLKKVFEDIGLEGKSTITENHIVASSGNKLLVEWHGRPILGVDEKPSFFMGVGVDITERKQAEEALRDSNQRFNDLVNSTDGIVWEADALTFQFLSVSGNAERMLGYPTADWMQPGFWVDHIYPEDREQAVEYCCACTGRLEDHDFRYRFTAADGRILFLRDMVRVVAKDGKPWRLRGLLVDATEIMASRDALTRQLDELRRWQDVMLDREDRVQQLKAEVNALAGRLGEATKYHSQAAQSDDSSVPTIDP